MTKKRLLLIAVVPLTIAVALGVLAIIPPSGRPLVENNVVGSGAPYERTTF